MDQNIFNDFVLSFFKTEDEIFGFQKDMLCVDMALICFHLYCLLLLSLVNISDMTEQIVASKKKIMSDFPSGGPVTSQMQP